MRNVARTSIHPPAVTLRADRSEVVEGDDNDEESPRNELEISPTPDVVPPLTTAPLGVPRESSSDRLAWRDSPNEGKTAATGREPDDAPRDAAVAERRPTSYRQWANPESFFARLDELARYRFSAPWAAETRRTVQGLLDAPFHDESTLDGFLAALQQLAESAEPLAAGAPEPEIGTKLRQARHALLRRLGVWKFAAFRGERYEPVAQFNVSSKGNRDARDAGILSGAAWESASTTLLADLERYESTGQPSLARRLAVGYQSLLESQESDLWELAEHLDQHYRNANLRIAISSELMNRQIPESSPSIQSVRDRIAGADVSGCSQTSTDLSVRLLPDSRRVRLGLEARGVVRSTTSSVSGPATFRSQGTTTFLARKLILVGPHGARVWPSVADADCQNVLCGLETSWDAFPLLRSLIRGVAFSQHRQRSELARQQVEQKVVRVARSRLDAEADKRWNGLETLVRERILTPLHALSLEATPIEACTTEKRIIWRTRLSGPRQLGAHTPRPRAPSDSQVSLQLHESALHNVVDRLELDGRQITLAGLYRMVADQLGFPDAQLPEDLPRDAAVTFAAQDSVRLRCEEGRVQIILAIAELSQGKNRIQNFTVTATYQPEAKGLAARLVREGTIRLGGAPQRTKSQVVLRGIFAKLFPRKRPVEVVRSTLADHPRWLDLRVTQFVIDDGWIALAIGPKRSVAE